MTDIVCVCESFFVCSQDEDVASDDEVVNVGSKKGDTDDDSDEDDDDDEAFDDEKHSRMLQDITKLPGEAFEGKF